MKGFTIKSTSNEGVYYLVNHWEKHRAFWIEPEKIKQSMLFKRASDAKCSLTKLLSIMDDYKNDNFELVEIYELNTGLKSADMVVANVIESEEVI
jgi:hypothetical protein